MLLAVLLCYAGFAALCLSMDRHHSDLLGRKASAGRRQGLSGAHIVTVDLPELHFYPVATYKQLPVAP